MTLPGAHSPTYILSRSALGLLKFLLVWRTHKTNYIRAWGPTRGKLSNSMLSRARAMSLLWAAGTRPCLPPDPWRAPLHCLGSLQAGCTLACSASVPVSHCPYPYSLETKTSRLARAAVLAKAVICTGWLGAMRKASAASTKQSLFPAASCSSVSNPHAFARCCLNACRLLWTTKGCWTASLSRALP